MAHTGYDTDYGTLENLDELGKLDAMAEMAVDGVVLNTDPSIVTNQFQLERALVKGIPFILDLEEISEISLMLSLNEFRHLCNALKTTTKLKVLHLSGQINLKQAVKPLQEALAINTSLRELYLISCHVDPEVCKSISEILKTNKTLRHIDVQWNYMSMQECYKHIADGLLANDTLVVMNMGENPLNNEGLSYLKVVAEHNKTLRWTNIDDSSVDSAEWRYVTGKFKENQANQKRFVQDLLVIVHNVARDASLLVQLPIEIWCHVFFFVKHPGVFLDFSKRLRMVFDTFKK
jgi:hypothetical protein